MHRRSWSITGAVCGEVCRRKSATQKEWWAFPSTFTEQINIRNCGEWARIGSLQEAKLLPTIYLWGGEVYELVVGEGMS